MKENNNNHDQKVIEKKKRSSPKILLVSFVFLIFGALSVVSLTSEEVNTLCNVNGSVLYKNSSEQGNWSCATIPIGITDVYATMFFHNDTAGVVTALTEDIWNNVTVFDTDYSGQTLKSVTYASSVLKVVIPGVYDTEGDLTFTGTANNKYHTVIGINGIPQLDTESHDRVSTGTDVMGMHSSGLLTLVVDDELTLMIMNEDSSGDATILAARVTPIKIGD